MSQKFTPLAQSRASYYCKGSPVHFVMVELFRMEGTGATVVTLTFKNLFSRPLVSFTAYFRCKNKYGEVVVEDSFTYDNVYAGEGECFGFDDAVFVSDEPLGSVEVRLGSVTYDDGAPHDLRRCPAVALPALRPLPQRERAAVCRALGTQDADYYPRRLPTWRCTCGVQYNAGRGIRYCSECGVEGADAGGRARCAERRGAARPQFGADMQFLPVQDEAPAGGSGGQRGGGVQYAVQKPRMPRALRGVPEQEMERPAVPAMGGAPQACVSIMKDSTADFILRYMPFVTMAAAAVFTMGAVLVSQYLL
ncbi:MAG: hypothetical protein ACLRRT_13205 [Ruthenibacterium lactatiformans]